jgi:Protein of unknown function (DUF3352)
VRLKVLVVALIILGITALALTGYAAYRFFFAPKVDDAISLVPRDSFVYGSIFLEPSTQQKMAIEDLLAKTPLENFDNAAERIRGLFDEGIEGSGCTFEEDFEPWLGDQIAGFALAPESADAEAEGAGLIATDDEGAARDAFYNCNEEEVSVEGEESYKGIDYETTISGDAIATIDGFLVIGTPPAVEAIIDAREGENLEDSERYQNAIDDLSPDNLATFYVDLQKAVELATSDPSATPEEIQAFESLTGGAIDRPITATLSARSDAVVLEYATGVPTEGPLSGLVTSLASSDVLATMPSDSWAAFGIGNFGGYVQAILDALDSSGIPGVNQEALEEQLRNETGLDLQNDVLSWMGDLGVFVRGTSPLAIDGGIVIEAKDEDAARGAAVILGQFLAEQGAPVSRADIAGARGFRVRILGAPQPINFVVGNEKAVVAFGDDATEQGLAPAETLGETDEFKSAAEEIGTDFSLSLYVEMPAVLTLVEASGATDETYREDVKPFLESVQYIASGSKVDDDTSVTRLVVGVQ